VGDRGSAGSDLIKASKTSRRDLRGAYPDKVLTGRKGKETLKLATKEQPPIGSRCGGEKMVKDAS